MKYYVIDYKVNGKPYRTIEQVSRKDGKVEKKSEFFKRVLDRIESLVMAGAVVTNLTEYN